MSRWNNQSREEQEMDFDQVLSSKTNAVEILGINNFIDEAKSRSSKFTQKIIQEKYRAILYELIDIALTPKIYMQNKQITIDRAATHGAIEILSNLSEEFIEEIFDKQPEEQDSVIQTEKEYPILNQLFKVLSSQSAQETALAYLNKIVTPFIYQRSEEMIKIVSSQLLNLILNYFWNQSVSEILIKLLQAESEKDFFEKEKIELIKNLCKCLENETKQERIEKNIESFGNFMESLVQKHEDKYDRAKYAKLIKTILDESQIFLFLFNQIELYKNNRNIKIQILHCIDAYLRIHLPTKAHSKISDSHEQANDSFKLNETFAKSLKSFLANHMVHEFVSDSRIELLNYYKLIKAAILVEPTLIDEVLTSGFLAETINYMEKDANNNILHNFQRQVLVHGIKESDSVCEKLKSEIKLQTRFTSVLSSKNSRDCFENQLFLISQAVKEKSQKSELQSEQWSKLSEIIEHKREFYSAVIGGNPRGSDDEKWQSIENENDMILKSLNQKEGEAEVEVEVEVEKQTIEEKIEVDLPQRKIMIHIASGLEELGGTEVMSEEEDDPFNSAQTDDAKNKHFFDFELPLDSDKEQSDPLNGSNSLDDIPIVIKIDSIQDNSLRSSKGSIRGSDILRNSKEFEKSSPLTIVIEDPAVELTTQIILEETQKEQIPLASFPQEPFQCYRQQITSSLLCKYGIDLIEVKFSPFRQQIEASLLIKYGLALK